MYIRNGMEKANTSANYLSHFSYVSAHFNLIRIPELFHTKGWKKQTNEYALF